MKDQYGRTIEYMRISITDRCNLRCKYCMPDGVQLVSMDEIMSYEEILLVCREAVKLGITKFKITGGEPLVRRGCADLIRAMKALPGVEQVTMTTNGILLPEHLNELKEVGLDGVNISLDTLCRERFQKITGFDELLRVLDAIEQSVKIGMKVKINTVLQIGENDDEWESMLNLAKVYPLDVRFIELMPIGEGSRGKMVSNTELLERIQSKYKDFTRDHREHGNGPAVYYRIPGFVGSIGFISAMHGVFCDQCNRIRLTSTGEVKPCLCYGKTVSIRDAARSGNDVEVKRLLKKAIEMKPERHCFDHEKEITEHNAMVKIGG